MTLLLGHEGTCVFSCAIEHGSHMSLYTPSERGLGPSLGVVAALKHTHYTAFGIGVSYLQQFEGDPLVVKFRELRSVQIMDVVEMVGIKASRYENEIGLEKVESWEH